MRAMLTAAMSLVICWGLFGCNRHPQAVAPAPAPVAAVAPPCNCQPSAVANAAPVVHRRIHRHRHRWAHENRSYVAYESSESMSSSTYASSSQREYDGRSEASSDTEYEMAQNTGSSAVWVDGYGRSHYEDGGSSSTEADPGAVSRADVHARMSPWRGYNSDCDSIQ